MEQKNAEIRFCGDKFNRYYKRCILFAKSYTCDPVQAESMAAEAMVILWEKMSAGEEVEFVLPFLFSVIRNKALHYLKHRDMELEL